MKWVANGTRELTRDNVTPRVITVHGKVFAAETHVEALAREKKFRAGLLTGPPKATERCTVDKLQAQGIIGLYQP